MLDDQDRTANNRGFNHANDIERAQSEARNRLRWLATRRSLAADLAERVNPFLPSVYSITPNGHAASQRQRQATQSPPSPLSDSEDGDIEEVDSGSEDAEGSLTIQGRADPVPAILLSGYTSPFAQSRSASDQQDRLASRLMANDQQLFVFLSQVAKLASSDEVASALRCVTNVCRAFAAHPNFLLRSDGVTLHQLNKICPSSLSPCLFSEKVPTSGSEIPLLAALVIYCMKCKGPARSALQTFATSGQLCVNDLLGKLGERTLARDVKEPGLYVVNPTGDLVYVGMTHSLGLKTRIRGYHALEQHSLKLRAVQNAGVAFPGTPYALMWHSSFLGDDVKAVVPASAIYAAESMFIAITGSWRSTVTEVSAYCRTPTMSQHGSIVGLNTRLFDVNGAFLSQPSLNIAGAHLLIDYLIKQHERKRPMPQWRDDDTEQSSMVASTYSKALGHVFLPGTAPATMYRHIQLRSIIMRRALGNHARKSDLSGFYLPGKNGVDLVRRSWKETLW